MSIQPILTLIKKRQLVTAIRVNALFKPFYKLSYLAAAKNCGLLDLLAKDSMSFEALADVYCQDAKAREALEAWLHLGFRLRVIHLDNKGYSLKGLARKLSRPENDATLALAQEVAKLHHNLILETPEKLRAGSLWQLNDQDGELTARSSRALEAFLTTAIDRTFVKRGPVKLLEIGCGSASYIKYAAEKNSSLHAVGLELQPRVAEVARSNIQEWGLMSRVEIEICDVRDKVPVPEFDYVTLHNNIYYFPVGERIALLEHVRKFIKPGGFLLLTTCCQGGNLGIEALNLWGAATATAGRLPSIGEMERQLRAAGYGQIETFGLIPGDKFYAFKGSFE
jgi:SAM-dependent methyltransferase